MSTNIDSTMESARRSATFHEGGDPSEVEDYHSLSVLAVISLVLGLLAPLALTSALVMIVPIVGAVLALVALRKIATSEGLLAGRWAALAGLALSVASLLAVISYGQVLRALRVGEAREFGQMWLGRVQAGELEQAFRLTSRGARPEAPNPEPGAPSTNPYDSFLADPLIDRIKTIGPSGTVRPEETIAFERQSAGRFYVGQTFTVSADSAAAEPASHPASVDVTLTLQRAKLPRESGSRWLVTNYAETGAASNSEHDHSH